MRQAEAEVAKENIKPSAARKGNAHRASSAAAKQHLHKIDFKLTGRRVLVVK